MGKKINMLDCTLRDGGYINDWDFGHSVISGIYRRLDASGVEYIEVGFLDDRRDFDMNRSIMPNTDAINKIFGSIPKKNAIPVAMIDYGTCSLDSIGECDTTFIDGIRVIFKKEKIKEALPFCKAIKEKGYKLFIQAISITSYSDMEMLEYVKQINEVQPYAFSIVDTYGLLDNKSLERYFYLIDNNLDPAIKLGYHEHNNFQLGFSNTIKFLSMDTERELVTDATVYGMGKSAGNCASELLTMHLNSYYGKAYDINQLLEIVDTDLMPIYQKCYWGYKYNFYISALQACHPSYVQYLLDKKTLSVSSVNELLEMIPSEKKLLYDKAWIEQAYKKYQSHEIDDNEAYTRLKNTELTNKNIVLLGPGTSLTRDKNLIMQSIGAPNTAVISVNFYPEEYRPKYVFMSNAKRYAMLVDLQHGNTRLDSTLILTSNITPLDYQPDYILNYESLLYPDAECSDNSLLLLLNALIKIGVKKVYLAGFDGFSSNKENYYDRIYEFTSNKSSERNRLISNALSKINELIQINFITQTEYCLK